MYRSMKKPMGIVVVVGIAVLAVLLFFGAGEPGGGPSDDVVITEVRSDDGLAILTIPDGALPEGMTPSDISVKVVRSEDGIEDEQGRIVYELEPDGIVLRAPVELTLVAPAPAVGEPWSLPVLLHWSFDENGETVIEVPETVTLAYDKGANVVRATASISHFSRFSMETAAKLFTISAAPKTGTYFVGDTFDYTVTVAPQEHSYTNKFLPLGENREYRAVYTDVTLLIGNGTRWRVNRCTSFNCSDIISHDSSVITPDEQEFVSKDMGATESYTNPYPMTCVKEGSTSVGMRGGFSISFTLQIEAKQRGNTIEDDFHPSVRRESQYIITSLPLGEGGKFTCEEKPEFIEIGPPILCDPDGSTGGTIALCPDAVVPQVTAPELEGRIEVTGGIFGD